MSFPFLSIPVQPAREGGPEEAALLLSEHWVSTNVGNVTCGHGSQDMVSPLASAQPMKHHGEGLHCASFQGKA